MALSFRHVVTGHDEQGAAIIESDMPAAQILQRANRPGVTLTNFWLPGSTPSQYDGDTETCTGQFFLQTPAPGSVFRYVEFEPEDLAVMATLNGHAAFAEIGAVNNIVENARHSFMHHTDSVDYAIILTGEIYMLLDNEDLHLKVGDVVVQRGANHAQSNRGSEKCIIAFVLIDSVRSQTAEAG